MLRISLAVAFICLPFLFNAVAAESSSVTDAGVQSVFGPAAIRLRALNDAPTVDGRTDDPVWAAVPEIPLLYADERVEGTPVHGATVKVGVHAGALYVAMRTDGPIFSPRGEAFPFLNGQFVGLIWRLGDDGPSRVLLTSPTGKTYQAERKQQGGWDGAWKADGAEVKTRRTESGWDAEFRVPAALLQAGEAADGKLPSVVRLDFVRRFWTYATPAQGKTGLKPLRAWQTWRTRSVPAVERLLKLDVGADEDFGFLVSPEVADEALSKRLREASVAAAEAVRKEDDSRKTPLPGFEFSAEEIERLVDKPVLQVPLAKQPPTVDGDPGDPDWQDAPKVYLGFLSSKIQGRPRRNRTQVQAVCDRENLYFLFIAEEENLDALRAAPGFVDGGELWKEDVCNVILDVGRRQDEALDAYVDLLINAAGSVVHARRRSDTSWDPPGLALKTKLLPERKAWALEVKVPFRDLGVEAANFPKVWGVNLLRSRTPGRGDWINPQLTEDPAYFNFDFAWRGNPDASPHRPDAFGVMYLQVGNALPENMLQALTAKGASTRGLIPWVPPSDKPLALPQSELPPPPLFNGEPQVTLKAAGAEIEFEASLETDATVVIADAAGKIVKHLAAGRLCAKAPKPFVPGSLKQKLLWDFTDDCGTAVPIGNYQACVRLGLTAQYERFLLFNPNGLRNVQGLATDALGNVYVIENDHKVWHHASRVMVFDRNGKYLKQLVPYSGNLADERLSAAQRITLSDGRKIPSLMHAINQAFAPGQGTFGTQRFAIDAAGAAWLVNGLCNTETRFGKRLLRIEPDGGLVADYWGPVLGLTSRMGGSPTLALSADGRWAYLTGLTGDWEPHEGALSYQGGGQEHHVVYRLDLKAASAEKAQLPTPFIGALGQPGSAPNRFRSPCGLALDKDGNLYVADSGNQRIAAFKPDGTPLGGMAVSRPVQVELHPRTGALYVLSLDRNESLLSRYDGLQAGAPARTVKLPGWTWAVMALDASAAEPRLWLCGLKPTDKYGPHAVTAIDDKNDGFYSMETLIADTGFEVLKRRGGLPSLLDAQVDPTGKEASVWAVAVSTETGKPLAEAAPVQKRGRDGRLYQFVTVAPPNKPAAKIGGIRRFEADGKPAPFPAGTAGDLLIGGKSFEFAADALGRVYVTTDKSVDRYSPEGKLDKKDFIVVPAIPSTAGGSNGAIRVDLEGCVYLSAQIKPAGLDMPKDFIGHLPAVDLRPSPLFVYHHLYGSVVKFGPAGGKIILDKEGNDAWCMPYAGRMNCKMEGVEWYHFGLSPLRHRNVEHVPCTCEAVWFDVDEFGRVFLPDAVRSSVEVLDKNGNRLLRFGRWGNMDDDFISPGDPHQPALAWPVLTEIRGDDLFVTDKVNKRIVKMRLGAKAEVKLEIAVPER